MSLSLVLDKLKDYFSGLSGSQIGMWVCGVLLVIILFALFKKVLRIVFTVIVIVAVLLFCGVISKESVINSADILSDSAMYKEVMEVTLLSDNVKLVNGIFTFNINDTWYNLDDVERVRMSEDGVYLLDIKEEGTSIPVDNATVKKLFDVLETE